MEDHGSQQKANTLSSTVNGTGQTASLAREVEVEVQSQEVFEDIAGHLPDGLLRDTRKHCIAKFLEDSRSDSGCAVWKSQIRTDSGLSTLGRDEGFLQAMIIEPATVYAVPPTEAKSTFMESTMFLK
jgi:hypothetical protein